MVMTPDRVADVCDEEAWGLAEARFDVVRASEALDDRELRELLDGADVAITSWGTPTLPTELFSDGRGPTVIAHAAGSVKKLLPPGLLESGQVTVFSAAPRIAWSVGEYCLAACLTMLRALPAYHRDMRAGNWRSAGVRGQELRGARVGLIGASSTARAFRSLLEPFEAQVCVYDPYLDEASARDLGVERVGLEEVMRSDIVSVHVPSVPATAGMITRDLLASMPDGGLLINTSRATAVDSAALETEVLGGRLQAALDVYDEEPPSLGPELRAAPNVLLTPHIAGDSRSGHRALVGYVLNDVVNFMDSGRRGAGWVDPSRQGISA